MQPLDSSGSSTVSNETTGANEREAKVFITIEGLVND
jgi:hypothetical protein